MKIIIEKTFKNSKKTLNNDKINVFSHFFDILMRENNKFNLTRIIEKEEVAKKHFLDSVASQDFIKQDAKVIDIGAGAGFPSIPLKIIRDDLNFTLLDSVNKKVEFLNMVTKELNFKNIVAIHERCEDLAQKTEFREVFDVCVARAVAELNILCEYCLPFVKVGGKFIAYKSENIEEELQRAEKAIKTMGGKLEKVEYYNLDEDRKNCLIIITKIGRTPKQFPRRGNKPRLSPIM
ncbi:MAG: 16S rRNA (guanine(527)-N(7))-methyltransferase RsmG [Clostridia bacterium]|nr:16S rRNA (guanine(527)-N(7))-methyltransferase RsmG [Clostridia bacterium]